MFFIMIISCYADIYVIGERTVLLGSVRSPKCKMCRADGSALDQARSDTGMEAEGEWL